MKLSTFKLKKLVIEEVNYFFEDKKGVISSMHLPMGFVFDKGGHPQKCFVDVSNASKIIESSIFERATENGTRFVNWVHENASEAKSNFEEHGIRYNSKAMRYDKENIGLLAPYFSTGSMGETRGDLYHEVTGVSLRSTIKKFPSAIQFVSYRIEQAQSKRGNNRKVVR